MAISNPHSNPQCVVTCTTSAYFGSPRGLLSCCKTYPGKIDTVEVCGSSPHGPTIIFNTLAGVSRNPHQNFTCNSSLVNCPHCASLLVVACGISCYVRWGRRNTNPRPLFAVVTSLHHIYGFPSSGTFVVRRFEKNSRIILAPPRPA